MFSNWIIYVPVSRARKNFGAGKQTDLVELKFCRTAVRIDSLLRGMTSRDGGAPYAVIDEAIRDAKGGYRKTNFGRPSQPIT